MPKTHADDAIDLDVIMKDGLERFDLPSSDEAAPDARTQSPADDPTKPGPPAGEPPADETASFRFKNHAEAEKGYLHVQQDFTRVSQENAELKKKLTAGEQAAATQAAEEAAAADFKAYAAAERKAALDAVNALDPDDPKYLEQVADIQADVDLKIARRRLAAPADVLPAQADTTPMPPASSAPDMQQPAADPSPEAIREYAIQKISAPEIGLKPDDPLFWTYALRAPADDAQGQPLTVDDQIAWAVEKTLNYRASIAPATAQSDAEEDAAARAQRDQGLGRAATGSPGQGKPSQEAAYSLSDALAAAENMRRL